MMSYKLDQGEGKMPIVGACGGVDGERIKEPVALVILELDQGI
jgi:hypothetical protein